MSTARGVVVGGVGTLLVGALVGVAFMLGRNSQPDSLSVRSQSSTQSEDVGQDAAVAACEVQASTRNLSDDQAVDRAQFTSNRYAAEAAVTMRSGSPCASQS